MFETAAGLRELDDDAIVDSIVRLERLAAWVAAEQLALIAEFACRRPRSYTESGPGRRDAGDPRVPEVSEFAVDEVAAALRLSRPTAGVRLQCAVELTRLPGTARALAAGELDMPKVRAVVDAVGPLADELAGAVEQRVLPRAGRQTVGQLRASLSRAVLAVDPAAAEVRHERAAAGREVTVRPLADGMAELWALLPADTAAAVYAAVDSYARRTAVAGSESGGGMDARRADALVELVTGTRPSEVQARVHVTVPAATAVGLGDEPGELAGHGPIPASMARRLATGRTWRKIITDPATGVVTGVGRGSYTPSAAVADLVRARDRSCRFPGCRHPAARADLDHLRPWPDGPTTPANLHALCRHHHRLKHHTRWTVHPGPEATLTWTSPTGHRYPTSPAGP